MILRDVFAELPTATFLGNDSVDVLGVQMNSNQIEPGDLFVAIHGAKNDGHDFIHQAIERGAVAVWCETPPSNIQVPCVHSKNIREHVGRIAAKIYEEPTKHMTVIGVTGTNGKTTVCHLIEAILKFAAFDTAYLGTTDYRWKDVSLGSDRTTPEATELQRMFRRMRGDGVTHVAMECSSHGIELGRLNGIEFDVAVFTNLTQDHLDFHGDMATYAQTKEKLFTVLLANGSKKSRTAVYNLDDPYGQKAFAEYRGEKIGFSLQESEEALVYAEKYTLSAFGTELEVIVGDKKAVFRCPLVGRYNVSNILAAIAATYALQVPLEQIVHALAEFENVPGRMEKVPTSSDVTVIVDYAHTDDAMKNVLSTLRPICEGKLIVVFGCGGDRDKTKRPKMMKVVEQYADTVVVTIDNPRTENPSSIVADIMAGHDAGLNKQVVTILDRQEAIEQGIAFASGKDIVIITGKGHETYQEVQGRKIPFDDRAIAKAFLDRSVN